VLHSLAEISKEKNLFGEQSKHHFGEDIKVVMG